MGGERGSEREREGKGRKGKERKEGEESASPFPNSWIRPCKGRRKRRLKLVIFHSVLIVAKSVLYE